MGQAETTPHLYIPLYVWFR